MFSMRIFKLAVISAIVLFIIITAISSLLPSQVLVSRAADIKGSAAKVKMQVFDLKNWQKWMTDAKGQRGEYKFNQLANTLDIVATQVSITSASDTTLITLWKSSTNMTGTFRIIDHHRADSLLTIQWQMEQKVKWYPWQKFAAITKDEIWGASMEKSLENLKALVETQ